LHASNITRLDDIDTATIAEVINAGATRYEGVIPDDHYSEPYMPVRELEAEREKMDFFGVESSGEIQGVIGLQSTKGVTLIRHLYVRPPVQRQGVGSALLSFALEQRHHEPTYVGTWRDATWAIDFYESRGFENLGTARELLKEYWDVPPSQRESSVVLVLRDGS
jgi:GNAT superfamily N-acetyltransferase